MLSLSLELFSGNTILVQEKVFSNALTMYKPSTEVDNEQGSDEDEGSISSDDLELSSGDLEGEELLCADSVGQDCTVA